MANNAIILDERHGPYYYGPGTTFPNRETAVTMAETAMRRAEDLYRYTRIVISKQVIDIEPNAVLGIIRFSPR